MLYDIRIVTPENVTQLTIDPRTGTVVYMGHPIISGTKSGMLGAAELGRAIQPRVSLIAAISLAESCSDGKGLEARLDTRYGKLVIELDVVTKGGFISEFEVDAMSGKVIWMAPGSMELP